MTDHELEEFLGICCGNTSNMQRHIHETLRILSLRTGENRDWDRSVDLLEVHLQLDRTETDAMFTVYLHFLDKLDLIEHGSGIAGSWLTTHGKKVLEELDKRNSHKAL